MIKIYKVPHYLIFIAVLFFNWLSVGISQSLTNQYMVNSISTDAGLSHITVVSIVKDDNGFLWLGTLHGLNRYDGNDIKVYLHDNNNKNSISDNLIKIVSKSKNGGIWVNSLRGLDRLDNKGKIVKYWEIYPELSEIRLIKILESKSGLLWMVTDDYKLLSLDPYNYSKRYSSNTLKYYNFNNTYNADIQYLVEDPSEDNLLWLGTSQGLVRFNFVENNIKEYHPEKINLSTSSYQFIKIDFDKNREMYFSLTGNKLVKFDKDRETFQEIPLTVNRDLPDVQIFQFIIDFDNICWSVNFGGGINWIDLNQNIKGINEFKPFNESEILNKSIHCIYQDDEGIIWVGTAGSGFYAIYKNTSSFNDFSVMNSQIKEIISENISALCLDKNNRLWVSCRNKGVYRIPVTMDNKEDKIIGLKSSNDKKFRINSDIVFSMCLDSRNLLWIGNKTKGIDIVDCDSGLTKDYYHSPGDLDELKNITIYQMVQGQDENMWIAGNNGLYEWTTKGDSLKYYNAKNGPLKDYLSYYNTLLETEDGNIFIGTYKYGLLKFNPKTSEVKSYFNSKTPQNIVNAPHIFDLYQSKNKHLWVGSYWDGLYELDDSGQVVNHYSSENGLADNVIYAIEEDEDGFIWVSTNNGLSRINTFTKAIKNFSHYDGIQGQEYNSRVSVFDSHSDILYFGGPNGLNSFNPSRIFEIQAGPEIRFTSLEMFEKSDTLEKRIVIDSINFMEKIDLNYLNNFLVFHISAPQLPQAVDLQFAYKIDDLNLKWIDMGEKQTIGLAALPKGTHTLRIKAYSNSNNWKATEKQIILVIHPPWWKTNIAYIIYVVTLLSVIYKIYRYRINQLKRYQKFQNKVSRDLHDEVGTILSGIAMQANLMEYKLENTDKSTFGIIATRSREALAKMRDIVWTLDANKGQLINLRDRMMDYVCEVFDLDLMKVEWDLGKNQKIVSLPLEVKQNLLLIFKEAINNILRHSDAKMVKISIFHDDQRHVHLIIHDNGSFKKTESSGLGIQNMKYRAEYLKGQFSFDYNSGYRIHVIIPTLKPKWKF